uniref:CD83 molecule n=1 Tax=Capra hircus TaxID=9925 RepID=A0A8C2S2Z6_CAPHI
CHHRQLGYQGGRSSTLNLVSLPRKGPNSPGSPGSRLCLQGVRRVRARLPRPRSGAFHRDCGRRACSLAPAAREVKVVCSEDVDLPCTAPWDPQVTYTVSWAKLTDGGAERVEVTQEDLQSPQQRNSSEVPRERLYSLKIRNTTSCNSGGTVILQVTGCSKERRGETFKNYRAEIVLLLALVIFYVTLIIFTCKFARQQSIFPDFSKPALEHAFLPVTSPNKHLEPVTLHKTELV